MGPRRVSLPICWPPVSPGITSCWASSRPRAGRIPSSRRPDATHGEVPRLLFEQGLPMSSSAEPVVRDAYFEPVLDEITAHDLPVAGTLPAQLSGLYLRNGP